MIGQVGRIGFFRLREDEDLVEAIKTRAEESNIKAGVFVLIGALKNVVIGFYQTGEYKNISLNGPLEIASCMGNIAISQNGEVVIHAHIVVSNEKGEAFGGHLMKNSHVDPTAELVMIEGKNVYLKRSLDEKTRLNLLNLS